MKKLLLGLKKIHGGAKRIGKKIIGGLSNSLTLGRKAVGHVVDASAQVQGIAAKAAPLVALVGGQRGDQLSRGLERVQFVGAGVDNIAGSVGQALDSGELILRQSRDVLNNPANVMATARAIQTNAALGRGSLLSAYNEARRIV